MKSAYLAAVVGLALVSSAASAAGFDGASIRYQLRFPDLATSAVTLNAVVGPALEFNDSTGYYAVNLGGSSFTIVDAYGGLNSPHPFNGFVLSDITNNLAAITGVSFTGGGFAGEQPTVTFDADNIYLNFAVISQYTAPGTSYGYSVTFAAVPEPAAWSLLIAGFGLVGATMRRRSSKALVPVAFA